MVRLILYCGLYIPLCDDGLLIVGNIYFWSLTVCAFCVYVYGKFITGAPSFEKKFILFRCSDDDFHELMPKVGKVTTNNGQWGGPFE